MTLRINWCSYQAANFAVSHWHYSGCMPSFKRACLGVWEHDKFVGAIVFGIGATPRLFSPYGLKQTQGAELVRVALTSHTTPVSRMIAVALKMIRRAMPGLRLVISFADAEHNHTGAIYQASNWVYTGEVNDQSYINVLGTNYHRRTLGSKFGVGGQSIPWLQQHIDPAAHRVGGLPKYRYLYPLDDDMRRQIEPLRKPYPKRADSVNSSTAGVQPDGGGANPTSALLHEPEAADA